MSEKVIALLKTLKEVDAKLKEAIAILEDTIVFNEMKLHTIPNFNFLNVPLGIRIDGNTITSRMYPQSIGIRQIKEWLEDIYSHNGSTKGRTVDATLIAHDEYGNIVAERKVTDVFPTHVKENSDSDGLVFLSFSFSFKDDVGEN